jgi:lipopolysaccharide transport system permease protein
MSMTATQASTAVRSTGWADCLLPWRMVRGLWQHRHLIRQLARREIAFRYRGTYLGTAWAVINPLLMLCIYTFVFSGIFKMTWGDHLTGPGGFALALLAGLIPFGVFAEIMTRSPVLVLSVPNYVKKVVFPLEVLPVVMVIQAIVHSLISVALLIIGARVLRGEFCWNMLAAPIAYLPLIFLCLAVSWFLASLGMYMRDLSQGISPLVLILNFLTPIFYPVKAVPEWAQIALKLNPLTTIVAGFRWALLGEPMVWSVWIAWVFASMMLALVGYTWFVKTKKGFADVL